MKRIALTGFLIGLLVTGGVAGPDPRGILELEGYGNSDAVGVTSKRGRNDFTIKETLASGDLLFFIKGYGYNGTSFGTNAAAAIEFNASQAWTSTANGTSITIKTTPNGSVTPSTVATFGQDGSFTTNGLKVNTPTQYTIGAATEVTPTSEFMVFTTTGGAITWACTNACISTSVANGTAISVMSSTTSNITWTDSVYIQLSTTSTSANRVFSTPGDNINLRLYNGVWYEVSFSTGHE